MTAPGGSASIFSWPIHSSCSKDLGTPNDVLMTLFLVAALVAFHRESIIAGPMFALSALVKLFTIVLAPLLLAVMLRDRWGWRRLALGGCLAVLVVVISVM